MFKNELIGANLRYDMFFTHYLAYFIGLCKKPMVVPSKLGLLINNAYNITKACGPNQVLGQNRLLLPFVYKQPVYYALNIDMEAAR